MNTNTQKERFSLAYIEAVASQAGFQVAEPKVDNDSVDGILLSDIGKRPAIHFQAKATSTDIVRNGTLHFPLGKKNYDDLRAEVVNPRILIVLLMPVDESQWLHQSHDELCLRKCAYWKSLEGMLESPNRTSVTVHIPMGNLFGRQQLIDLMGKAERGDELC